MRKKLFLLCIVIIELSIIAFLAGKIYLEKSQVLGENVSLNPILKDDVIFPNQESDLGLKYFYEPKPNNTQTNKPAWLPLDYAYIATINSDSLNERFDYSIEKDSDVFRIITLGDSYTFGWSVNTEENYPERLEDLLNNELACRNFKKYEVINLGFGGYDIEYAVHRFKERGQKYNPDLVLWLVKNDDIFGLKELTIVKEMQYDKEMGDEGLFAEYQKGNFYPAAGKAVEEIMAEFSEAEVLVYNKKALERIIDYYKGKLVSITFTGMLNGFYASMLQDFISGRSETYFYNDLANNYDHFEDWHPTSKGYAQIAGEIFDYLTQNGLVPCDSP